MGNKLMSSRLATCLIWPPPECHFEFTSQVRKEEERGREGSWNFQNGFGQPLKGGEEAKLAESGGPVSVAAIAVAVVRFVRLLMRACEAAACGRNGDEALKWQMFPLPYLRPPHTACLLNILVRILIEKCCKANLACEKYDQGTTRLLKPMHNNNLAPS